MNQLTAFLCFILLAAAVQAEEITLYSHRHYKVDDALFAHFTEKTGIRINVVKAKADELIERLKAEGEQTKADVFMTADAGKLHRAKVAGLLQPIESQVLESRIPPALRDPEHHWFGFTMRARVIVYAVDRVDVDSLSTYEQLARDAWYGRVLVRSSSNIYNQSLLASLIAARGKDAATRWARAVRSNMSRPPQGSDRDQIRAVAAGLGDVALVNTYYVGLLLNSTSEKDRAAGRAVGVFFPNQEGRGAHVNISGAGVTAGARNPEAAVGLLEFLVSDHAQSRFPQATYEYPVVEGVPWSDLLSGWGQFKADSLNVAELGGLNSTAVRSFDLAGWE